MPGWLTKAEQVQTPHHARVRKITCKQVMQLIFRIYNRKRPSASYIAREVCSTRERDTERERERERERGREREIEREIDGSDVTIVALKLVMSFALFLAKNLHLSFSPQDWR